MATLHSPLHARPLPVDRMHATPVHCDFRRHSVRSSLGFPLSFLKMASSGAASRLVPMIDRVSSSTVGGYWFKVLSRSLSTKQVSTISTTTTTPTELEREVLQRMGEREKSKFPEGQGSLLDRSTPRRHIFDKILGDPPSNVNDPDVETRERLFRTHLSGAATCNDVDHRALAEQADGFQGNWIETVVNLATLKAASDGNSVVSMENLSKTVDSLIYGRVRKILTAYHEAGHAVVNYFTQNSAPIKEVTILPLRYMLGHVSYKPWDRVAATISHLMARMDVSLAGYVVVETLSKPFKLVIGCRGDLLIARQSAMRIIGPRTFNHFVGEDYKSALLSPDEWVENEVHRLLEGSYQRAKAILDTHSEAQDRLAKALLKNSTMSGEKVVELLDLYVNSR